MQSHSCYRLLSAFDITLSCFTLIVWTIFYHRAEGLIRLQFETDSKNDSFIDIIPNYRANIRSVGSQGNEQDAAETLYELYILVNASCTDYQVTDPSAVSQRLTYLHRTLAICFSLIMISSSIFLLLSLITVCTTRKGKASHKYLILTILIFHVLFTLTYGLAAVTLFYDPVLCALTPEVQNIKFMVFFVVLLLKPLQAYINILYYREVAKGVYIDDIDSSSDGSIYSGLSSNEDYILRSRTRLDGLLRESDDQLREDDLRNQNKLSPIYRKLNATDIPRSHDLELQKIERDKKSERKLLVRGRGLVPLSKVNPDEGSVVKNTIL